MRLMGVLLIVISTSFSVASELKVPSYQPAFWNDDVHTMFNNNCYNYSTNRVTNSFAQPGEASGEYFDLSCLSVAKAAAADLGLTVTLPFDLVVSTPQETLIALVVAPDYDFHWYRRGQDNLWTHKPGSLLATNLDQSDNLISSPEVADRGDYTDFCGYFKINNYVVDGHDQNVGYVRIGNMSDLPKNIRTDSLRSTAAVSEVEVLLYSGRQNPRQSLKSLLRTEVAPLLRKLVAEVKRGKVVRAENQNLPSKLGYNGIRIHDAEGLLLERGTSLFIKGQQVQAYLHSQRSIEVSSPLAEQIEKYILKHVGQ